MADISGDRGEFMVELRDDYLVCFHWRTPPVAQHGDKIYAWAFTVDMRRMILDEYITVDQICDEWCRAMDKFIPLPDEHTEPEERKPCHRSISAVSRQAYSIIIYFTRTDENPRGMRVQWHRPRRIPCSRS